MEILKTFDDNSIDQIVTDPPYELKFMNHKWDSTGIQTNVELWSEVLRVLKPGGYMLQFSSQRTYHRMQVQIEDQGFIIKDMIDWIYSSGMPKGSNISKQIDKKLNIKQEIVGVNPNSRINTPNKDIYEQGIRGKTQYITEQVSEEQKKWEGWNTQLKPQHEPICMQQKPLSEKTIVDNVLTWNTGQINVGQNKIPLKQEDNKDLRIINRNMRSQDDGWGYNDTNQDKVSVLNPEGRYPQNVIFDEDSSKYLDEKTGNVSYGNKSGGYKYDNNEYKVEGFVKSCKPKQPSNYGDSGGQSRFYNVVPLDDTQNDNIPEQQGRYPQNIIFDKQQGKYLDKKTGILTSGKLHQGTIRQNNRRIYNYQKSDIVENSTYGDSGGQSRFYNNIDIDPDYDVFYYNGKQISEREKYNNHPTLKPLKLMELLVKLITPPNGIVLDIFQGSGTTQLQCINNNFNYILIELNKEYVEIQEKRIEECKNKSGQQQLF